MRGKRFTVKGQLPVGRPEKETEGKPILHLRHVYNSSLLISIICLFNFIIQVPISCQIPPFSPTIKNTTITTTFNPATHSNHLYPMLTSFKPTSSPQVFASLPLDRRTEQPLMQRPGKLLADYVTHQGQRILKNLVNTTIADLVAQSTVRIVNPNKLLSAQHPVSGPFPAMGRLYTLLFPTQTPNITTTTMSSGSTVSDQQLESEQKQIPTTPEFGQQELESATTGTEDQFSSFHHLNSNQADNTQTSSSDIRHLMTMSMGAPYDPRPRSTSKNDAPIPHDPIQIMNTNDNWHRPGEGLVQDSSGLFLASGSEQHAESNTADDSSDADGMQSSSIIDTESLGTNYGEQVQATAHNGAVDVQQTTDGSDQDNNHNPVNSADLSGLYSPTHASEQDQQVVTDSKRGEEGSMMDLGGEGRPSSSEEENFVAPISQQLVEAEMIQPTGSNDSNLEQSSSFAMGPEDFSDHFTQTTNLSSFEHQVAPSDDSYFTAHLPVQYETALRAPPEGHYDDYFKLLSNTVGSGSDAVDTEFKNQLAIHSQDDSAAFFTNSDNQLGNRSARHFVQDSKLENNLERYLSVRRPRDHSGMNYGGSNGTRGLQYEVQHIYERIPYINQSSARDPLNDSNLMDSINRPDSLPMASRYEQLQHRNSTTPSEDNLQVIIAKTNYGRGPMAQEKVINYTSENHNFTWSGKSPRNNFINKDMNEMPVEPVETPHSSRFGPPPVTNSNQGLTSVHSGSMDVNLPLHPQPSAPPTQEQHYIVGNLASSSIRSPLPTGQFERPLLNREMQPQLVQIVEIDTKGQQSDTGSDQPMHLADAIQSIVNRQNSQSAERQDQQQKPWSGERKRSRGHPKQGKRNRGQKPHRSSSSNKAITSNGQPLRPQVTQVHLRQQEEPSTTTASASSSETGDDDGQAPADVESKLPDKIKQLREHPPDKNELMNELLSALDRVKVAIYKLQPLTAKMNAIYRKSVTSNTRDTIMDNHKGTYAKRYPPGDYDDTYDRVQPNSMSRNEIVSRSHEPSHSHQASSLIPDRSAQPESTSSSTMLTGEVTDEPIPRVGAELEASDSDPRAVFLRMQQGRLSSGNRSSAKQASRRWKRRVTSLELDSLNATESRVVATGIGRRFGDRNLTTFNEKLSVDGDGSQSHLSASSPQDLLSNQDPFVGEPLFGYRITIYQKPGDQEIDSDGSSKFAYRVDGLTEPAASPSPQEPDLLTASESSVVGSKSMEGGSNLKDTSSGSQKKSSTGGKRDDNWKKSDSGRKEDGKESKHQKEYKKIKHNKGLMSKERKSMHRDKNVKSHDRGAAKEKALKERTQIEFFEREQIVDDEFEKAKKSNANVNWQSGYDSKKAIQAADLAADTISSGGSHYVNHYGPNEKSHTVGSEQTSGKKSTKSDRRHLEAKGKKFKGWREKGYKIITETEFIDRGSLHDSAYRKRDKGSALQQKYRRQQSASEGQHGSTKEHHKKLHRKEEKRENAQQTMEERDRDELKNDKSRNKKSYKKATGRSLPDSNDIEQSGSNKWEQLKQNRLTGSQSIFTTFRPILASRVDDLPPKALLRLINSAHHEKSYLNVLQPVNSSQPLNRKNYYSSSNKTSSDEPEQAERRADVVSLGITGRPKPVSSIVQESLDVRSNNATVLDIVDNTTGRQVNKTKIGTYDLSQDDENNNKSRNSSIPLSKIANSIARYSAYLTRSHDKATNRETSTSPTSSVARDMRTDQKVNSDKTSEHHQINSNKSNRQQQQHQPPLINSQNHNYLQNQNHNYNFDLLEYKRQMQMRANHQLNHHIPFGTNTNSINHIGLDKQPIGQFVRPTQAEAAAQILRLIQQATMKEPPIQTIPAQPASSYMDFLGPLHRSALMAPGGVSPFGHIYPEAQQPFTRQIPFMPSSISYGMNPFGPTQFSDYDQQSQTFLAA